MTVTNRYPKSGYAKDPEALHLYVRDIRIITPEEYEKLKAAIPLEAHRIMLDILLITGMRYIELIRLHDHAEWYNEKRNIIHLPEEAQRKHKRRQPERTIHPLPSMFGYILKNFWNERHPPSETGWNENMQRWAKTAGIQPYGMSVKTTRKTIESWLIAAGIPESAVCLRQGHDNLTSMRHYQGLAFSDDEVRDIKTNLTAWGFKAS